MAWKILFYETESGKYPVKKFLDKLQLKAQQKVTAYLKLLEENGTRLASNYLEKVKDEIRTLRPEYGGNEYRIFLFFDGEEIILLHAIRKNTKRISPNDIETAEKRRKDWLRRKKEKK